MPIVGAVLDLFPRAPVPVALASDPRVELGVRAGDRIPVVFATSTLDEDRDLLETTRSLPGVAELLVSFADLSDLHEPIPDQLDPASTEVLS
jgi:hypothetical protein